MPRKIDKPIEPVMIRLYAGDRAILQQFFPAPVGYNMAVRELVHQLCKRLQEKASREGAISNVGPEPDSSIIDGLVADVAGSGSLPHG